MENNNMENREPVSAEELGELFQIRRNKLKALQESGQDPFVLTRFTVTNYSKEIQDNFENFEEKEVTLAGRMMTKRTMGKASFCDLQDKDGRIQLYIKKDIVGEEVYQSFKELDLGDIIGITGCVFRTHKGEISVRVEKLTLLSKSLQILPEKFHGLKDTDIRYRQRYLDLIVNPEVKDTFRKRSEIIRTVRNILEEKNFLEVETPILMTIPSGAAAKPFNTYHNALDMQLHLRISLELPLKRLIVGGFDRVYEIGRVFRNEGISTRHNPEFTLLELYQAYTDYQGMMDLTEELFRETARRVLGTTVITYGDVEIDLGKPFARLSMKDAVKQYAGIDFDEIGSDEEARALAKEKHIEFQPHFKKGEILNLFFEEYAEKHLVQPTFIMDHPVEISPLAKKKVDAPGYTERFELFILTREHANAFSELNDPIDQKERFMYQESLRAAGDEEANRIDDDFITALEYGMPPTGGLGIGMDRMIMLLTNAQSIRDVLLFPTMKNIDGNKSEKRETGKVFEADSVVLAGEEKIDFSKVKIEPLFEDYVDFETFGKSDFRAVKVLECEAVPKSKKLLKFTLDDGTGVNRTILSGIHNFYEPEELLGKTCIAITNLPPRPMMGIESCGMLISAVHEEEGEEKLHLLMVDPHIPAGAKLY